MKRQHSPQPLSGTWTVLPLILFSVAFFILPLIALFRYSFYLPVPSGIMEPGFTLENYQKFFSDSFFYNAVWITIKNGIVTTLVTLLLGYPIAYFFVRYPKYRGLQLAVLVSPLLVNIVIRAYAWRVLLSDTGLVNTWLLNLGIVGEPISFINSNIGVIIVLSHILLPFMVLAISSSIEGIDHSLEEAGATLGANTWVRFRQILLPLSVPGIVAGSILVFTHAAGSFVVPSLIGGGRVHTIPTLMYMYTTGLLDWPFGAVLAFVMAVITLVALMGFTFVTMRKTTQREAAGGT